MVMKQNYKDNYNKYLADCEKFGFTPLDKNLISIINIENDGIPVLRIGNINAGYFKPVNMVYWQEDESLERYAMYPGDLVMSLTGTVGKDDYGNVCILGDDYEMYYLNQRKDLGSCHKLWYRQSHHMSH